MDPLNPLTVTLGVSNVSFVAQAVDWIPEILHDIMALAFHHKGFSFVRVLQRCPEFLPDAFDPWVKDPARTLLLVHEDGIEPSPGFSRIYRNQEKHDPLNMNRAREIASATDPIPVGILYRNRDVPRYEEIRDTEHLYTAETTKAVLNREFDKFTIWPAD